MKKLLIILFLIPFALWGQVPGIGGMILSQNSEASKTFQVNNDIIGGLTDVGAWSAPSVFYIGTDMYLVAGNNSGGFVGFKWNGTLWDTNTAIVSGLVDYGTYSNNTVFNIASDVYMITGLSNGLFYGYKWNGTTWDSDANITSGLVDVGYYSTPTVFYEGTDMYLISGELYGTYIGYKWNGASWDANTSILTGISNFYDGGATTYSKIECFYIDSNLYSITNSNSIGTFAGYKYTTEWVISEIDATLNSTSNADITVFSIGTEFYMIMGNTGGTFTGYKYE